MGYWHVSSARVKKMGNHEATLIGVKAIEQDLLEFQLELENAQGDHRFQVSNTYRFYMQSQIEKIFDGLSFLSIRLTDSDLLLTRL